MSEPVKGLTDVVKEVSELGKSADSLAAELRKNLADVTEGLNLTKEVSDALRAAGAQLRGALGVQSNHPPKD